MTPGTPSPSAKLLRFLLGIIPELAQRPDVNPADVEWLRQFTQRLLLEAELTAAETPREISMAA